jgi:hypothetical protein
MTDTVKKNMLADWNAEKTVAFQKEILTFQHRLIETGLFTDEALAELLNKHPSEELDVCTMGTSEGPFPNRFRTGDFRDVDGMTLIDAAKAGAVWINVRRAMNIHPEYRTVLNSIYGELAEQTGNQAFNPKGGILISSPVARVPYHVDKTETILWHIRGKKRIYLYPRTEDFLPEAAYEATLTDLINDDLPYNESMDANAKIIDLQPGQALTWPLNSPHRVDNRAFCVSITTEYSTKESGLRNSAMLTNAVLRSKFGMNPSYHADGPLKRKTKSVMGRALRKARLAPNTSPTDYVTFKVDPKADNYIADTEPFERNF